MKSYNLRTEDPSGAYDDRQLRYFIDDKRTDRDTYNAYRRLATRMDSFETSRVNGVVIQYCVAYIPEDAR